MVGAMIGMVLTPIDDSEGSVEWILGALSVAAAICPIHLTRDSVSNVNSEKEQKKPKTGGVGLQGPGRRRMRSSRLRTFSTPMQCQPEASSSQKESGGKQATTTLKEDLTGAYLTSSLRNAQFR
jgi:hypothetical protein